MNFITIDNIGIDMYVSIPLQLLENKYYREILKDNDLIVYGILRRRSNLSMESFKQGDKRFVDSQGRIFIYYTVSQLAEYRGLSESTVKRSYNNLKEAGLLYAEETEESKRSFKKVYRYYVLRPKEGAGESDFIYEPSIVSNLNPSIEAEMTPSRESDLIPSIESEMTYKLLESSNKNKSNKNKEIKETEQSSGISSKKEFNTALKALGTYNLLGKYKLKMKYPEFVDYDNAKEFTNTDFTYFYLEKIQELHGDKAVMSLLSGATLENGKAVKVFVNYGHVKGTIHKVEKRSDFFEFLERYILAYKNYKGSDFKKSTEFFTFDILMQVNKQWIADILVKKAPEKHINEKYIIAPVTAQRSAERTADTLKRAVADEEEEVF